MIIRTIRDLAMERAEKCNVAVGKRFLSAVRPIYGTTKSGAPRPEPIGTCTLLAYLGAHFVVTAAHVIDHAEHTTLYIGPLEGDFVKIEGQFQCTTAPGGKRSDDHFDFAFWRLPDALVEPLNQGDGFIREDEISHNRGYTNGRQYMLVGYPVSKNKRTIKPNQLSIKPIPFSYQGSHLNRPELFASLRLSGEEHILIHHQERSARFDGSVDNSIGLVGASGGPLVDLGPTRPEDLDPSAPCIGLLAGIAIEDHPRSEAVLFVKIQTVLSQIQKLHDLNHDFGDQMVKPTSGLAR